MYSIATKAQPQGWQPNWSSALILYRVDNLLKIITSFTSFMFYGRQERLLALLNVNYHPSGSHSEPACVHSACSASDHAFFPCLGPHDKESSSSFLHHSQGRPGCPGFILGSPTPAALPQRQRPREPS